MSKELSLLMALENLLKQLKNVSDYCQTCTEEWVDGDLEHQALCATEAAYGAVTAARNRDRAERGNDEYLRG